jgi:hypothetical protein
VCLKPLPKSSGTYEILRYLEELLERLYRKVIELLEDGTSKGRAGDNKDQDQEQETMKSKTTFDRVTASPGDDLQLDCGLRGGPYIKRCALGASSSHHREQRDPSNRRDFTSWANGSRLSMWTCGVLRQNGQWRSGDRAA